MNFLGLKEFDIIRSNSFLSVFLKPKYEYILLENARQLCRKRK